MAQPEVNLFTYIDQIRTKSRTHSYNKKLAPAFLLLLGISNNNQDLKNCNKINQYLFTLPDEIVYEYLMATVPKGKVWAKWPKKAEKDKEKDKLMAEMMKTHKVSKLEALKNLEVLVC